MRPSLQIAVSLMLAGTLLRPSHGLSADNASARVRRGAAVAKGPRTELTYPQHVPIPDDIPSVALIAVPVKSGDPEQELVYIPGAYYLEAHYDGWQRCLSRVADGRFDSLDNWLPDADEQRWTEKYELRGAEDGFTACAVAIRILRREKVPDATIRRMAAGEYLKRGLAPLAQDSRRSGQADAK
jgi:hypothetical protein